MRHDCGRNLFSTIKGRQRVVVASRVIAGLLTLVLGGSSLVAGQEKQSITNGDGEAAANPDRELRERVADLEAQVRELREIVKGLQANPGAPFNSGAAVVPPAPHRSVVQIAPATAGANPPAGSASQ